MAQNRKKWNATRKSHQGSKTGAFLSLHHFQISVCEIKQLFLSWFCKEYVIIYLCFTVYTHVAENYTGKQHTGFILIRDTIAELKVVLSEIRTRNPDAAMGKVSSSKPKDDR